jgi:Tfp pilus assembly protein PilN
MRRINLLPASVLESRQRQRQRTTIGLGAVGAGVLMAAWLLVAVSQVRSLDGRIALAEFELQPLRQLDEQRAQLRQQEQTLQQRLALVESLREPLSAPAILALLSQLTPEQAVMRSLSIELPPPALAVSAPTARPTPPSPATGEAPRAIQIQLEGLATHDAAVATLVSQLTQAGLFHNVRLADSRQVSFQNVPCYQFRLSMEIPLTRPASASTREYAIR